MGRVAEIWRHPIKAVGREALEQVSLSEGACVPWDRHWAVRHDASKASTTEWSRCGGFNRGASSPQLMAVTCVFDDSTETIELAHPKKPRLVANPNTDGAQIAEWLTELIPSHRPQPHDVISVPGTALTDSAFPSISILSLSSLKALSQRAGLDLDPARFRGNIWLEGFEAWQEEEWVGRTLRLGQVDLEIREPIERCLATSTSPITGERDVQTLELLEDARGRREFGLYGVVTKGGLLRQGDLVNTLP
ncbi:MAG: MOSC domain-containing protein [Pseudomonadota bacterium]